MIRFLDGVDLCSGTLEVAFKYVTTGGGQGFPRSGRDGAGSSFAIVNTGFGVLRYAAALSAQPLLGFHADIMISREGTTNNITTPIELFQFADSVGVLCSVRIHSDFHLDLYNDSTAGIIASYASPLSLDTWYTLECKASFAGAGVTLRLNGANVASGVASFARQADRVSWGWEHFGPPSLRIDNFVVWDGQTAAGDTTIDFVGRCRVTSLLPQSDLATFWTPSTGLVAWNMVNDPVGKAVGNPAPDSDTTYIAPAGSIDQLFGIQNPECFGLNMALALNACARQTAAGQTLNLVGQLSGGLITFATLALTTSYKTGQGLKALNPDTSDVWKDSQIANGSFGVEAGIGAPLRVTCFYLEKLTTLLAVPFDCGGGSYSF